MACNSGWIKPPLNLDMAWQLHKTVLCFKESGNWKKTRHNWAELGIRVRRMAMQCMDQRILIQSHMLVTANILKCFIYCCSCCYKLYNTASSAFVHFPGLIFVAQVAWFDQILCKASCFRHAVLELLCSVSNIRCNRQSGQIKLTK